MSIDDPTSPLTTRLRDSFASLISARTSGFSGRDWVFDAVDQWLGGSKGDPFLLCGRPGTGKSAIAARLVQMHRGEIPADAARPKLQPGFLSYYHFCQVGLEVALSPPNFVQAWAESLASRYPEYRNSIESRSSRQYNVTVNTGAVSGGSVTGVRVNITITGGDARGLFDELVRRPLLDLAAARPTELITILVDSLDEAMTFNATNNIARLVATTKDLPANVRFLLTSRSEIDDVSRLVGEPTLDLIADAPPGLDEVRTYAARRLGAVPEPVRGSVSQRLADQSRGNFLYAYHVLNLLERERLTTAQLETFPFPDELEQMYEAMMFRQLTGDKKEWNAKYRPLLGTIAVAHGDGLSRKQLIGITGLDEEVTDDLLNSAAEYLTGGEGLPYRLYHHSFREFLLRNDEYGVYPAKRHIEVARWFEKQFAANWEKCSDEYALRYTARHWCEAADASDAERRAECTQSAAQVTLNMQYRRAFEREVGDLVELRDLVFQTMRTAVLNEGDEMLPCVLRASLAYPQFSREYLQSEALVKLAEEGLLDEALSRMRMFNEISESWQHAARQILCWLAIAKAPAAAAAELAKLATPALGDAVLGRLSERAQAALKGDPQFPCPPPVTNASVEVGRELVKRIGGNSYDQEMLQATVNPSVMLVKPVKLGLTTGPSNQYAAELDGPALVSIARTTESWSQEGTALFDQYVQAHAGYNYVVYRNESLWFVLNAVLGLMPDQAWVRDRLKGIVIAALTGGAVEFLEMLPMSAKLLRARLEPDQGKPALHDMVMLAGGMAQKLLNTRGSNDVWGNHKRRLTSIMELATQAGGEPALAQQLQQRIPALPDGFAGFQAPAWLRFADGLVASGKANSGERHHSLRQASVSAQHIQDYHFCARVNARCNALARWHAAPLATTALKSCIERLIRNPLSPEFASDHVVRDPFVHRAPDAGQLRPIDAVRNADNVEKLAEVFQRRASEFLPLNPGMDARTTIPAGTLIHVPDPGLAPLLAVHLAARVLADPALAHERANLIRSLIVTAAVNATAMDSLLAYLLVATPTQDKALLDEVLEVTGPVTFANHAVPFGQIGPDSVLPA